MNGIAVERRNRHTAVVLSKFHVPQYEDSEEGSRPPELLHPKDRVQWPERRLGVVDLPQGSTAPCHCSGSGDLRVFVVTDDARRPIYRHVALFPCLNGKVESPLENER